MPPRERNHGKAPESGKPRRLQDWLARLNEFGERHARVIISVSAALVILTVLIFAKYFYDRSMVERAERELAAANTVERLKELKEKYSSYPAAARLSYRLGNKYFEEGNLEAARNEYTEFQERFPGHPLTPMVLSSLEKVRRNIEFDREHKTQFLKLYLLQPHPILMPDANDPRLQWAPMPEPNPTAEIEVPGGTIKVELHEYEAPNAVANFVKLCEEKYFDGIRLEPSGDGGRLRIIPKDEKAAGRTIRRDGKSDRAPKEGSLILVPKEGGRECPGGEFEILLKAPAEPLDVVVFGTAKEKIDILKGLKKDDAIKSAKITSKRQHEYEPEVVQKP